ncbi:MAG: hypothetical protein ACTTIO_01505 [Candidatus Fimenecus sp.]
MLKNKKHYNLSLIILDFLSLLFISYIIIRYFIEFDEIDGFVLPTLSIGIPILSILIRILFEKRLTILKGIYFYGVAFLSILPYIVMKFRNNTIESKLIQLAYKHFQNSNKLGIFTEFGTIKKIFFIFCIVVSILLLTLIASSIKTIKGNKK